MLWKKSLHNDEIYRDLFGIVKNTQYLKDTQEIFNQIATKYFQKKDNKISHQNRMKGNEFYRKKQYEQALESYNVGICLAENGSDMLSLGYANRSACFFELEKYELCLADIDLAKGSNYPPALMSKLDQRQEKCLKLMKTLNNDGILSTNITADFVAGKTILCMADGVKLTENKQFGKHYVATQPFNIGDTILIEEPYCATILINHTFFRCSNCFKKNRNFIPCKKCSRSLFCVECIGSPNQRFHDFECEMCIEDDSLSKLALVVRTIIMTIKLFPNIDEMIKTIDTIRPNPTNEIKNNKSVDNYREFFNLCRHHEELDEGAMFRKIAYTNIIYEAILSNTMLKPLFVTERHQRFLMHLILHHMEVISINPFDMVTTAPIHNIYFEEGKEEIDPKDLVYAQGIYLNGSIFNHSCIPNVLRLYDNNRMICKIVRPVQKGDQLYIDYL